MTATLPDNLKAKRQALGWSQEALARKADVPNQTVSRAEQGATEPRLSTIAKLAEALGCTVDDLLAPAAAGSSEGES